MAEGRWVCGAKRCSQMERTLALHHELLLGRMDGQGQTMEARLESVSALYIPAAALRRAQWRRASKTPPIFRQRWRGAWRRSVWTASSFMIGRRAQMKSLPSRQVYVCVRAGERGEGRG